jgi:hypothetical protein
VNLEKEIKTGKAPVLPINKIISELKETAAL